jgi:hypothetical protein
MTKQRPCVGSFTPNGWFFDLPNEKSALTKNELPPPKTREAESVRNIFLM